MSHAPWWDTERDVALRLPPAIEPATCLLCGLAETSETIRLRPAFLLPVVTPDGGIIPARVETLPRCLDEDACRTRVRDNGDDWPLRERGTDVARYVPRQPVRASERPAADAPEQPVDEGSEDAWF